MTAVSAIAANADIKVASTSQCMDVEGGSQNAGAAIIQWGCHGGANQQWQLHQVDGYYKIVVAHSGQCLTINGADTTVGRWADQETCVNGSNQQFKLRPQGVGHTIVARHSGLCLGIESASLQQGARVTQQTCDASTNQTWRLPALLNRAASGEWTQLSTLSLIPAAAANLPDGKVLMWSAEDRFNFAYDGGRTYTLTYNPINGATSEVLVSNTGHDMFCPGTANLSDGRIHVTGGLSSSKTSVYDPVTGTWAASAAMNVPRGYHSSATLSAGDVFIIGGSWSGGAGGKDGEVWKPSSGAWRRVGALMNDYILTNDVGGISRADNHAWLFAASGGKVFHAGPSQRMHWFSTSNNGTVTDAGSRGNDADAMNGNAVMYDTNKILTLGGAPNYENAYATANAHVINIGVSPVSVEKVASMNYARAYHNSVVLPDGKVMVIGGQSYAVPFSDNNSVMVSEIWNPKTKLFTPVASIAVPRNYHSMALLLPDARVLSGGGGLCGNGCAANHPNVQIFSPPYLFNTDGTPAQRPVLTAAPAQANVGTTIAVSTDRAVTAFSVVRLSSSTHSVNNEQRRIPLKFATVGTNQYSLTLPNNRGVLVPGYYMLFALNQAGVPSVSRTIRIL
jgi:galactose oxidase